MLARIVLTLLLGVPVLASAAPLPQFPPGAVWHRDITDAALHPDSASMIGSLQSLGGWGNGNRFQIDFSFFVLHADASAPTKPVVALPGAGGYYLPDCDAPGFAFPVPPGGAIEGSPNNDYSCSGGDCHLLVVQGDTLYEAFETNVTTAGVVTRCALRWDLRKIYPPTGRGEQCTSADAAGFPIAPLLFNADEVAAAVANDGDLGHAIRFILPNSRIARQRYVHPASHGTSATSGPQTSVPYGVRMRLRPNFDMSRYNPAARVILRTMQHYGIVLSDGGNIALTGEADRFTTTKWADLGINPHVFVNGNPKIEVGDFEVIDTGPRHDVTYDCARTADDFVFIDGYDH